MDDELVFLGPLEQAALIRAKDLSPVELVAAYLARIEALDGELNSYVLVRGDDALIEAKAAAERAAAGGDLPPFLGVPIPIKDLYDTEGITTSYGSRAYAGHVPDADAATVRRFKEAGFIVLGKSNTSEFGQIPIAESDLYGPCRNPWDTTRTPGGSSGGAAASVAAGLAPAAHGSDGGGSIRIPASCCGLFGLKPSRGRVSQAPDHGESWQGFSTQGVVTRSVADSAALLDVVAGYETGDPYWAPPPERPFAEEPGRSPGRLRIGVVTATVNGTPVGAECLAATEDAAGLLEELGHAVAEITPSWDDPEVTPHFIHVVEATAALYPPADPAGYEALNRVLAEQGATTSALDYVRSVRWLHGFARRVVAQWDEIDILLTPTLPMPPPEVGWIKDQEDPFMQLAFSGMVVAFTAGANITGQPAASVPLYWTDEGLPIGVQLTGAPAAEATLFRLAAQLEAARPWAARRPPHS